MLFNSTLFIMAAPADETAPWYPWPHATVLNQHVTQTAPLKPLYEISPGLIFGEGKAGLKYSIFKMKMKRLNQTQRS